MLTYWCTCAFERLQNIIKQSIVSKVREAGGITPKNIDLLNELSYNDIGVASGVMKAVKPDEAIKQYSIKTIRKMKKANIKNCAALLTTPICSSPP